MQFFFSEIPGFLSEQECDGLLSIAEGQTLEQSDVFHFAIKDVNADHETKFADWDHNKDDVIDENEVVYTGIIPFTLSRVINFKFPLQLHQKYYISQYEEVDFS